MRKGGRRIVEEEEEIKELAREYIDSCTKRIEPFKE